MSVIFSLLGAENLLTRPLGGAWASAALNDDARAAAPVELWSIFLRLMLEVIRALLSV